MRTHTKSSTKTETSTSESVQELLVVEKELIIYNDDYNSFDHVINCLIDICEHEPIQAEQCTFIIHNNGKCQVKRGKYQQLEPRCTSLLERGLSASIE